MTTTETRQMVAELAQLDPRDIDWHAARYDSAAGLQGLVKLAHKVSDLHPAVLVGCARAIARRCQDDGADYGFIPCLAGEHRRVWLQLRSYAGI